MKTLKNSDNQSTRHHRKGKCYGGSDHESNISIVSRKKHQAYHTLFGDAYLPDVVRQLNEIWIDPKYEIIIRMK